MTFNDSINNLTFLFCRGEIIWEICSSSFDVISLSNNSPLFVNSILFIKRLFLFCSVLVISSFSSSEFKILPVFALSFNKYFAKSLWQMFSWQDIISKVQNSSVVNWIFNSLKLEPHEFLMLLQFFLIHNSNYLCNGTFSCASCIFEKYVAFATQLC